jgi:hypothetical protein
VVGRLVEQQHVGPLEQQGGQHAAHLPAARELAEVAPLVAGGKAQAGQDGQRIVLGEEALVVIDTLVQLAGPGRQLEQRVVVLPAGGQLGLDRGQLVVEGGPARHRRQHEVAQAAPALDHQVLRQPADPHAAGAGDLAVVELLLAGDDLEQRGLAGAVGPDQADALAVADAQVDRVEDHAIGEEHGHAFEDDQAHGGCGLPRRGPG